MTRISVVAAFILGVAATVPLFGVGRPHLNLSDLVGDADVIVIADVSPSTPLKTPALVRSGTDIFAGHEYASELRVRSVIKGRCPDRLTVKYALPESFMGYRPLQSGLKMVFLRLGGNGYEIVNQYYPDLPASDEAVSVTDPLSDDQLVEVVLRQFANVIASSTASESDKIWVLMYDYAIPASELFKEALKKGVANAATQRMREKLQAELLIRGDLSELSSVVQLLLRNNASPHTTSRLQYAISTLKDRRAVPSLIPLLSSSDRQTRAAASEALWHIADPNTAEILLKALEDPYHEVRYCAVRALADITGEREWGPSIPEFKENEDRYLHHWKQWARSYRAR
ncbi:MAG TPA: HEAT repeat domain-containing protein [Terriglobales bacterium]|nr:HEAT repeat domain-containing protein [Terriglobales bacterium]